jgi:ABC-2 type transport system ATP-binding protein
MTESLSVNSLGFRYPGGQGFRDVTFTGSAGEIVCIFGLNGSGKTTLFRVLSTLAAPQTGQYKVCGMDVFPERNASRRKIFPVFDSNAHFDHLSGKENIDLVMGLYGLSAPDSAYGIAGMFNLDLDQKVNEYSLGMKRKLYLAESFLSTREILLFDEPALGLDSSMRSAFFSQVSEAAKRKACVVFCTNRVEDASCADSLWKMEQGTLTPVSSADELIHGMVRVTISFKDHDITEYIPSAGELPELMRKILPQGVPRKISIVAGDDDELWTEEARLKIGRAPRLLQNMISNLVERHAEESGYSRITAEVVDEVRRRFEQR